MIQQSKMDRIKELVELLNKAGKSYYSEGRELMSNYEYDALYDELEEDNKKGRYNPFIDYIDKKEELKNKVDRLISMSLGMATKNIEQLNLEFNKSIIDNIIYSGVYLRYKSILEKGCESNVQ